LLASAEAQKGSKNILMGTGFDRHRSEDGASNKLRLTNYQLVGQSFTEAAHSWTVNPALVYARTAH
jgi:hypothetical protein